MFLRIILELITHSSKLLLVVCRVCYILWHGLVLHPSFSTRLAATSFSLIELLISPCYFFKSLSQELLSDVTKLVCILLRVDLNILTCHLTYFLPVEPLSCFVESVVWDEIFDEYVLFVAGWNWTYSCPTIGKLVTRCQVALEANEAARSKAAWCQSCVFDKLLAKLTCKWWWTLFYLSLLAWFSFNFFLQRVYLIVFEEWLDNITCISLKLVIQVELFLPNVLLRHSSILTWVEICVSILWTILYVMSRLLTPITHIRVRELVDRLSPKLSREAKLAPILIAYGL